jgi:CBS-domain-containing membrane protein
MGKILFSLTERTAGYTLLLLPHTRQTLILLKDALVYHLKRENQSKTM